MIWHVEIETAEDYKFQIFNLIEEIQDTFESTETQTESHAISKETLQTIPH